MQLSTIRIRNIPEETKLEAFKKTGSLLDSVIADVMAMKTTIDKKNTFIQLLKKVVNEMKHLNVTLLENSTGEPPCETVVAASTFVYEHLSMYDSVAKRDKLCQKNDQYVNIKEAAVGTHWVMKPLKDSNISIPKRVQSTMEYIPLLETIASFFKDDMYKQAYFQHNQSHICDAGRYEYFCCGQVFKDNEMFQNNPCYTGATCY